MNIIVKPYGCDRCYCRPDTTWERENKDFYVPDGVDSLYWVPVIFARVSKAGKCINPKFVSRYYDSFNFGILMYTGEGEIAFTSCADHTSILPSPLYNPVVMDGEENRYEVFIDGKPVFAAVADKGVLEDAICRASRMTSVRIGDFVAAELDKAEILATRNREETSLKGIFCERDIHDCRIIF